MIIAEDLLLLAYDDATGKPDAAVSNLDYRLAGALLVELALDGRIALTNDREGSAWWSAGSPGRVVVSDPAPAGHPALDAALAVVGERPREPKSLVDPLSKGLRDRLLGGLAERGILRREEGRILRIFPTTSWPAADSAHEERLRARCAAVLTGSATPDARTAALIAVARGSGLVERLVPKEHRRQARERADRLAEESWASGAVKKAVDDVTTAVMVAVMVPAIVSTTT